ncbi:MAG: hypothetical protein ABMA64_40990, partial [Myxococcota bacterium]
MQQRKHAKRPTAADLADGFSTSAGLASEFAPGRYGEVLGLAGDLAGGYAGGPGADEAPETPFPFLSAASGALSTATSLMPESDVAGLPGVFGAMGSTFGLANGVIDAFDGDKTLLERVISGAGAVGDVLGLWGQHGGFAMSSAGALDAGAALTAGGAASAGAAGAVLGTGLAGYG